MLNSLFSNTFSPNFIIGTGRSGTSLLAQILNNHSQICVPPELQILFEYDSNGLGLIERCIADSNATITSDELISIIENKTPHNLHNYFDYKGFCEQYDKRSFNVGRFIKDFYQAITKQEGKKLFLEQTPWYGQRIDLIKRYFPSAKFIHVIRDGRDVAASFVDTDWWYDNYQLNMKRWSSEINKIVCDAKCHLSSRQYCEVKYEDLVINPEVEIERVLKFLGKKNEKDILSRRRAIDYDLYSKQDVSKYSSKEYNSAKEGDKAMVFSSSINRWKSSAQLINTPLTEDIKHTLVSLGYEFDENQKVVGWAEGDFYPNTLIRRQNIMLKEQESTFLTKDKLYQDLLSDCQARGEQIKLLEEFIEKQGYK